MPPIVNVFEAKSTLSRLIEAVESGAVSEVVIARNGRPAARLVPVGPRSAGPRIGVAKGKFRIPDPDPHEDAAIQRLFEGRAARGKKRK